jgi:hypothetical protein
MGLRFKNKKFYYKVTNVQLIEDINNLFVELTKYEKRNKKEILGTIDMYIDLNEYDPELINMNNLVETAYNLIKLMNPDFSDKEVR